MALNDVGSLVLQLLMFITTLVNFSYALVTLDALTLLALYGATKMLAAAPEAGIFSGSNSPAKLGRTTYLAGLYTDL